MAIGQQLAILTLQARSLHGALSSVMGGRHAVLIDVIVHPNWQRQGIGQALVAAAVKHIRKHSISIIHVDFEPELTKFYERCGFHTGLGGIYEG
jgi:GNAT superfamily N-acetyltransferase